MTLKRYFILHFLFVFLWLSSGVHIAWADEESEPPSTSKPLETMFYSDRFIFRSKDVDDLLILFFVFERGQLDAGYYGEFFGAVFEKNRWSLLEGNDKYPYPSSNIEVIQPSYYAKAEGSTASGFVLGYDGGDYTLKLSSGSVQEIYLPDDSPTLKKKIGITEAVVTIAGKEVWGDLIHESLFWKGFNGLTRYKGLYKDYHAFYLKAETGQQIYFHQNKADPQTFLKKYNFSETLLSEGGIISHGKERIHTFKAPIPLSPTKRVTPPFAFYTVPERWQVDVTPDFGSLFLWTRGKTAINWFFGGYYVMAIEGVIKKGEEETRVWGFAEYFP